VAVYTTERVSEGRDLDSKRQADDLDEVLSDDFGIYCGGRGELGLGE